MFYFSSLFIVLLVIVSFLYLPFRQSILLWYNLKLYWKTTVSSSLNGTLHVPPAVRLEPDEKEGLEVTVFYF